MQTFEPEASRCLQNLKTLSIDLEGLSSGQFDSVLQVQNSFPTLVNIELKVKSIHKIDPNLDLQKVTHLTGYKCLENPFKILRLLSSAEVVELISNQRKERQGSIYFRPFILSQQVELNALNELTLKFPKKVLRFAEFLLLFSWFPNLTMLSCCMRGVPNFNEEEFCQFLEENKNLISNLKKLELNFETPIKRMTYQSVIALLKLSNIFHFVSLVDLRFTEKNMSDLVAICKKRNLNLSQAFHSRKNKIWFSCHKGRHSPIFPEIENDFDDEWSDSDDLSDSDSNSDSSSTSAESVSSSDELE